MPIKRINEFPEGSGSLSNDDVFLFMDNPEVSGVTKKISFSEIADAIRIEELHNVAISVASHRDTLIYNSGNALWENKPGITSVSSGIVGASGIFNIIQISQANYDSLATKDANTLYIINN